MGTIPTISIGSPSAAAAEPIARRALYMILLLAIKDWATDVEFEPSPAKQIWKLRYKVRGNWYDLEPAPLFVSLVESTRELLDLKREPPILRLARLATRWPQDVPTWRVQLAFSDQVVDLYVTLAPAKIPSAGRMDAVAIHIAGNEPAGRAAARFLTELFEERKRCGAEFSDLDESQTGSDSPKAGDSQEASGA